MSDRLCRVKHWSFKTQTPNTLARCSSTQARHCPRPRHRHRHREAYVIHSSLLRRSLLRVQFANHKGWRWRRHRWELLVAERERHGTRRYLCWDADRSSAAYKLSGAHHLPPPLHAPFASESMASPLRLSSGRRITSWIMSYSGRRS